MLLTVLSGALDPPLVASALNCLPGGLNISSSYHLSWTFPTKTDVEIKMVFPCPVGDSNNYGGFGIQEPNLVGMANTDFVIAVRPPNSSTIQIIDAYLPAGVPNQRPMTDPDKPSAFLVSSSIVGGICTLYFQRPI